MQGAGGKERVPGGGLKSSRDRWVIGGQRLPSQPSCFPRPGTGAKRCLSFCRARRTERPKSWDAESLVIRPEARCLCQKPLAIQLHPVIPLFSFFVVAAPALCRQWVPRRGLGNRETSPRQLARCCSWPWHSCGHREMPLDPGVSPWHPSPKWQVNQGAT